MARYKSPFISVILATKNEEKNIARCIDSIKKQSYPKDRIEILVVDNNSTDKTREIARKIADKVYNLPEIMKLNDTKNFRGAQLNMGVAKSKGEIIFFPDTDMSFDRTLLQESVHFIQDKHIDALYIPEVVLGHGLFGKIRNFERSFYNMTCIDAVRIVKKTLFVKIGGFDIKNIKFGPDDWDFTKRIKQETDRVAITLSKLFHHEQELDFYTYLAKKRDYANTFEEYIEKWGKNDPDVKKQFGVGYRYWGVFVEEGKWKKLLSQPFLTLGMYLLRFFVGTTYLFTKF